jgi:hypothetical protein
VRLPDTLAVCYRGRRITSEGSESHRPRGARLMSALGQKQTSVRTFLESASPPKADMRTPSKNVC